MRWYSRRLCRRPLLFVMYILFFYGFLRCLFSPLIYSTSQTSETDARISKSSRKIPICIDDLLNQRDHHYAKWARFSNNQLTSKSQLGYSCRLISYTAQQVVTCFDLQGRLHAGQQQNPSVKTVPKVHFVFIGDSRMRQQFFYFLKLVPDYDRITNPIEIPRNNVPFHHGDVDVDSNILGLRISFKWRPIINDTVMEMTRHWAISNDTERPTWILLSMEIYHMMQDYGADHEFYQARLAQLGPILNQLANVSRVIWLNQYPVIELYSKTGAKNTEIHTQKVYQYNKAVRRILNNFKSIRIWDSSNVLAEEYVRSCLINSEREYPNAFFIKNGKDSFINCKPYLNCLDYVHTGYVALSRATQLLYNDICNKLLDQHAGSN